MTKTPEIDLEPNDRFQTTEWRAQRFGWIVWALVVLAALAGLLGSGWLSNRNVTAADGSLAVKYDRFLHYHHPSQIELSLLSPPTDGEWHVTVDRSLLNRLQILHIEPEPARRVLSEDAVSYIFLADRSAAGGNVVLHVEYQRYGGAQGGVAVAGRSPILVNQFVYP
jgi:hypothetical protein